MPRGSAVYVGNRTNDQRMFEPRIAVTVGASRRN
jgi:hypothetical protein